MRTSTIAGRPRRSTEPGDDVDGGAEVRRQQPRLVPAVRERSRRRLAERDHVAVPGRRAVVRDVPVLRGCRRADEQRGQHGLQGDEAHGGGDLRLSCPSARAGSCWS
jgi:hypothetical protein